MAGTCVLLRPPSSMPSSQNSTEIDASRKGGRKTQRWLGHVCSLGLPAVFLPKNSTEIDSSRKGGRKTQRWLGHVCPLGLPAAFLPKNSTEIDASRKGGRKTQDARWLRHVSPRLGLPALRWTPQGKRRDGRSRMT